MSPADILARLAELQAAVKQTSFEFNRMTLLRQRKTVGWDDYVATEQAWLASVNERDAYLQAITAHQLEWCHDSTDCALCAPVSTTIATEVSK